jgi:hypothetical protein
MEGAATIKTSIPLCGLCAMLSPLRFLAGVTRGGPGLMDERLWVAGWRLNGKGAEKVTSGLCSPCRLANCQ